MPGNEVGDRVHNFFGQENLGQDQHQGQTADRNWSGLSSSAWFGGQRSSSPSFGSNLKNCNAHPLEGSEGGHARQFSHMPHGLNFTQSNLRPEFGRDQSRNQQQTLNGYVPGHQFSQTRPNEANLLGVDPEFNKKNLVGLETADCPVDFDFFAAQQHMTSTNLSRMQTFTRQQSGTPDMQLLQQQAFLVQMQELQRQQPQQIEAKHQVSSIGMQPTASQPLKLMNGVSVNDVSNYQWHTDHRAANPNWLQHGASLQLQGSPNAVTFPFEPNSALRMMGLIPPQVDQSLYGVPISSTKGMPGPNSVIQLDKPAMQQISIGVNSFPGDQHTRFLDQAAMQGGSSVARPDYQEKNMLRATPGQNPGLNSENLWQANHSPQQRNAAMQEFHGRQEELENTEIQITASQTVATLDPTEEKILYGSDDSLWDAFGRSANIGSGGYNMSDGTELYGAYPSLLSGTWSALMQSAVAETSSDDIGLQEDSGGLSFRNAEPSIGNEQPASDNDSGKMQPVWFDSNLRTASTPNSRPSSISLDANSPCNGSNYRNVPGFQQQGLKASFEQGEGPRTDSAQIFNSRFSGVNNMLDHKTTQNALAEASYQSGNLNHSSDMQINTNSIPASWARQQGVFSYNRDSHPFKSDVRDFIGFMPPNGGDDLNDHEKWNLSQTSQGTGYKRVLHGEMSHAAVTRKTDSGPNSNVQLQHAKPATESPQIYSEGSCINNDAAVTNSCNLRPGQESRQLLPKSRDFTFWKDVDSSVNYKGNNFLGKYQNHLDKSPQVLESSGNSSLDKGVAEMQAKENSHIKENSNNSFRSSGYQHTSAGGSLENPWSDASDTHALPGSGQKSSGNAGRKPSGTQFQYHPMGDLDVDPEPSFGTKHVMHSPDVAYQQHSQGFKGHDQGSLRESNSCHIDSSPIGAEKDDAQGTGETPSEGTMPGFPPAIASSFNKSVVKNARDKTPPGSQNMLELLQKVDQAKEFGTTANFSPSIRNHSEMPGAGRSDGSSSHTKQNQSSVCQGFGLQLAPPSQPLPMPDTTLSTHSSSQTAVNPIHATSEREGKGHAWLSTACVQSFPSSLEPSQGDSSNYTSGPLGHTGMLAPHFNTRESFRAASSAVGFSFPSQHFQNQQRTANHSTNTSLERLGNHSRQMDETYMRSHTVQSASVSELSGSSPQLSGANSSLARNSSQQFRESDAMITAQQGAFPKSPPNAWTSVSSQNHLGARPSKTDLNSFKSYHQSNNNLERTLPGSTKFDGQDSLEVVYGSTTSFSRNSRSFVGREQPGKSSLGHKVSHENGETHQQTLSASHGKDSAGKNLSDISPLNSATTQRDVDAVSQSLTPSNGSLDNYSLLRMHTIKCAETDAKDRNEMISRSPDCDADLQHVVPKGGHHLPRGYNQIVREGSVNLTSVSSVGSKTLNFPSETGDGQNTNVASQDGVAFVQHNFHNFSSNNTAPWVMNEHSQISPQMAPSWFDQYGSFKNGQMFLIHPAHKNATAKATDKSLVVGKPIDSLNASTSIEHAHAALDRFQLDNSQRSATLPSIGHGNFLSHNIHDQGLVVLQPKKRKSSSSDLIPWHKELTQGSEMPQNISMAEIDWARATNRVIEKVEDDVETVEDGMLMLKPKKRLILTTQLMQQLLHPPPSTVFSVDASSNYESVAYFVSSLALGDACNATSCSGSDTSSLPDSRNILSEKFKASSGIGDRNFTNAMEEFVSRARKLENYLLRRDKTASILDLRVECLDLEKFSVINRFAKFHGRGQSDGGETSSSSGASPSSQKCFPQRYVTAFPMPKNLPDRSDTNGKSRRRMDARLSPRCPGGC